MAGSLFQGLSGFFILCILFLGSSIVVAEEKAADFLKPIRPEDLRKINPGLVGKRSHNEAPAEFLKPIRPDTLRKGNPRFLKKRSAEAKPADFLKPIRPDALRKINPAFVGKRSADDFSVFDPLDSDVFIWGNPPDDGSDFQVANMTLFTDDGERIISLERFAPLLKSVECGEKMTLVFNNKESFEYAIKAWNWVNDEETHKFILITDHGACAPEDQREPFLINDVDYDEEKGIAYLFGEQKEWQEVAHDMDLVTGQIGFGGDLQKRGFGDWTAKLGLPIEFPFSKDIAGTNEWSLKCTDCGIGGKINTPLTVRLRGFKFEEFSLKITPENVRAGLALEFKKLNDEAPLSVSWAPCLAKFRVPIPGTGIPGVIGLESSLQILASVALQGVAQETTVTAGISAYIPDDAVALIDMANRERDEFSGWALKFEKDPVKISRKIKGSVSIGPVFYLSIGFKVLGWGVETGLHLKPDVTLSLDGFGTEDTTCPKQGKEGTSFAISVGAGIFFTAGMSGASNFGAMYGSVPDPLWEPFAKRSIDASDGAPTKELVSRAPKPPWKLCQDPPGKEAVEKKKLPFATNFVLTLVKLPSWVLWETCIGGGPGESPPGLPPPPPPPAPSQGPPCNVAGKEGECRSLKDKCPGGHFNPGSGPNWPCKGKQDVQCCIPGKPEPEMCNVGGGRVGRCQPTSTPCDNGYYDAGVGPDWPCSGDQNSQCCIRGQGPKPPPAPARCEVNGRHGTCRKKGEGCPQGYFDPGTGPDWPCTGGKDVECCIRGTAPAPKPPPAEGKPGNQCKAPEGGGICGEAKFCRGISYTEPLCPGSPANVQCCVEKPCEGVDPAAMPWENPRPRLFGVCKRGPDCSDKGPPLPLGGNTAFKYIEPIGRDFLCPGDQSVKCCVRMDGRKAL